MRDSMNLLRKLESMGLRPDSTLRLMCERMNEPLRAAFSEVMYCDFGLESYDHSLPSVPPGLVPMAHVGNGDFYGLYVYPPADSSTTTSPIVQFLHEVPCVEYEAPDTGAWLLKGIERWRSKEENWLRLGDRDPCHLLIQTLELAKRPALDSSSIDLPLPTEKDVVSLEGSRLDRWLVDACPPEAKNLLRWEIEWVRWWTSGEYDDIQAAALLDFGLEVYEKLGWQLHALAVKDAGQLAKRPSRKKRSQRAQQLWCRVNLPSTVDLGAIIGRLAAGDREAESLFRYWHGPFRWDETVMHTDRKPERDALAKALVDSLSHHYDRNARTRIESMILFYELEEKLEALVQAGAGAKLISRLGTIRESHSRERRVIAQANDWSDL